MGLTGELKPVPGLLLAALHALREGHALVVPQCNLGALALLQECEVRTMTQLAELADRGRLAMRTRAVGGATSRCDPAVMAPSLDLADVRGQWQAKRALLVAAAGGLGLLMCGPPGSGKSMLAQRLPGLLPPLSREEALEVAAIGAVARQGSPAGHRFGARPFRAPHHTASAHAIVGGGVAVRPGEVSLAHRGVLFLDELPEFDRRVLEALREPLESGAVSVVREPASRILRARFPTGGGDESLSLRTCRAAAAALSLRAEAHGTLSRAISGTAARSHRPAAVAAGG